MVGGAAAVNHEDTTMETHFTIPPLDRAEIAAARLNLRQRLAELTGNLGGCGSSIQVYDPAPGSGRQTDTTAAEDPDAGEREAVLAALARIENGTYGDCVSCSAPIGRRRLHVTPHAANCILCEAERLRAHWCADKPVGPIHMQQNWQFRP